jgi:hypothetical protein
MSFSGKLVQKIQSAESPIIKNLIILLPMFTLSAKRYEKSPKKVITKVSYFDGCHSQKFHLTLGARSNSSEAYRAFLASISPISLFLRHYFQQAKFSPQPNGPPSLSFLTSFIPFAPRSFLTRLLFFFCRAHSIWHVKEKLITLAWKFKRPSTLKKLSQLKRQSALHFFVCSKIQGREQAAETWEPLKTVSLVWWGDKEIIWKEIKSAFNKSAAAGKLLGASHLLSLLFALSLRAKRREVKRLSFQPSWKGEQTLFCSPCTNGTRPLCTETNLIKMNNASCRKLAFFPCKLCNSGVCVARSPFILAISPSGERKRASEKQDIKHTICMQRKINSSPL